MLCKRYDVLDRGLLRGLSDVLKAIGTNVR